MANKKGPNLGWLLEWARRVRSETERVHGKIYFSMLKIFDLIHSTEKKKFSIKCILMQV